MIVLRGLGSSLIITQGYGRLYLSSFVKVRDFELSFYKFVKENYVDSSGYPAHYGSARAEINTEDVWIQCNFSELNVETKKFSIAYIDIVGRLVALNQYNETVMTITNDIRTLFINSDIDLYDFTYSNNPQKVLDEKIIVMHEGIQVFERVEELEFEGHKSLIQANQITIKMKLLKSFAGGKTI